MKNNNLLFIGLAGVIGYMIAPKEIKDKLQNIMPSGGGGGLSLNLGDIGGSGQIMPESWFTDLAESLKTVVSELPNNPVTIQTPEGIIPDWFTTPPEWLKIPTIPSLPSLPDIPNIPNLIPNWNDGGGSALPDLTMPTNQQARDIISRGGGVYGRQIIGSALTGTHILRPLPFASKVEAATAAFRVKPTQAAISKVIPESFEAIAKKAASRGIKVITHGADDIILKGGSRIAGKTILRVLPKTLIPAAKISSRAIPVVGWGLLVADIGADLVRVFGVDVPEWLGLSGIVSAFTGENPIEKWAGQSEQQQGVSPSMALADPTGTIARMSASVGQPEAPVMAESKFTAYKEGKYIEMNLNEAMRYGGGT